jgi:aspartyl-tRNA(Asn)/glutamyl-tRNA(Gln) amidotransferase subunit A
MEDTALTMVEAIDRLRSGHTSSVELVRRCLAQIERLEPELKACVTVMAERALEQAREADAALATKRDRRPLLGIPMGIKDLMLTRGVRTTAGSRVLADWIPDEDATVVTKLAEAGAIALCKTNTHEFAFGTLTPPTRNPWDTSRAPGGSSGGSAVAVATGEALAALGTDTGCSIRLPAAWCGVTGLKPTFGLVSRTGIIPLSWSLDHVGPIARTVEDCALLLDALAGHDPRDPYSLDVPLLDFVSAIGATRSPEDSVRGTRIGVPANYFFDQIDAEVDSAVRAAIRRLEELGASVEEVQLPSVLDDLFPVYRALQRPEAFVYHTDQGWLAERADRYTPEVLKNIRGGGDYTAADYVRARRTQQQFTDEMRTILRKVNALALPTAAIPAPTIAEYDFPLTVNGQEIVGGSLRCCFPFDISGQPAIALPCGFTASGLPIGFQLAAAHFGEATLVRLGHAYQRVTDWHIRIPPIAASPVDS